MKRSAILATAAAAVALVGVIAAVAMAGNDPNRQRANLTGAAERPDPGDPNGTGTAFINLKPASEMVCFNITFSRIGRPVAGHIHRGGRNTAGPILVPLFESGTGRSSPIRGCERDVSHQTIRQIKNNPAGFYVNLHNKTYPAGALRGQLKQR